jgi:hypothetical protein
LSSYSWTQFRQTMLSAIHTNSRVTWYIQKGAINGGL